MWAEFLATSTVRAFVESILRRYLLPILLLYSVVTVSHVVLVVELEDLRDCDSLRAGHTVLAASAAYKARLLVRLFNLVYEL